MFRLGLVRKEQCTSVCTKITPVLPAERDNQETGWVSEPHTRGKALELSVLLEVCMSPVVLRHVGVELNLLCGFQDQATVLFCPGLLDRACVKLCTTVKEANTLHQLSLLDDTELIVTPMIHGSAIDLHESSPSVTRCL